MPVFKSGVLRVAKSGHACYFSEAAPSAWKLPASPGHPHNQVECHPGNKGAHICNDAMEMNAYEH